MQSVQSQVQSSERPCAQQQVLVWWRTRVLHVQVEARAQAHSLSLGATQSGQTVQVVQRQRGWGPAALMMIEGIRMKLELMVLVVVEKMERK